MVQFLSITGALLILAGYAGIQLKRLTPERQVYNAVNLAGALLLGYVAVVNRQAGFIVLEAAWIAISVAGLARSSRR